MSFNYDNYDKACGLLLKFENEIQALGFELSIGACILGSRGVDVNLRDIESGHAEYGTHPTFQDFEPEASE